MGKESTEYDWDDSNFDWEELSDHELANGNPTSFLIDRFVISLWSALTVPKPIDLVQDMVDDIRKDLEDEEEAKGMVLWLLDRMIEFTWYKGLEYKGQIVKGIERILDDFS